VVGRLGGPSTRKGIVPASDHLWSYQPRPPGFSGTRCHRTTDDRTYIGEITARNQGCLSFWAQVYVGGASGLIADSTAMRHCPIRNKSLRSFFRTSLRPCGFTIPRAAQGRVRTANTASSATAVQIFYSSHRKGGQLVDGSVQRARGSTARQHPGGPCCARAQAAERLRRASA
jgi:hypothetical protein